MKLRRSFILTLAFAAALLFTLPSQAADFKIDPLHSSVEFKIRHLMSKVSGRFNDFSGSINIDENDFANSSVNVIITVESIDTKNKDRDEHLKSPDFFDAASFPDIIFTSTKITGKGNNFKVTGDFSMHGITKPITLDVEYLGEMINPGSGLPLRGYSATGTVNRKEFGISWNKALDTGSLILGEDIEISIEIEARVSAPPKDDKEEKAEEGGEKKSEKKDQ